MFWFLARKNQGLHLILKSFPSRGSFFVKALSKICSFVFVEIAIFWLNFTSNYYL
jgi:hypothetical protein